MVDFTIIEKNLNELKNLYDSSTNSLHQQFYSKLALLECCGWVEISFDEIAKDYINRKISESGNKQTLQKKVDSFYSVKYEETRMLFSTIIGMKALEDIESTLDENEFLRMKSSIGTIKALRDKAAHTPLNMTLAQYSSPHTVLSNYNNIKTGILSFQNKVSAL